MIGIIDRIFSIECTHPETIVVRTGGLKRVVCEGCGLLSFSFDPVLNKTPDPAMPEEALIPTV